MSQSVLIIEDEESAARLLAALCGELGLQTRTSRSGTEALALLQPAGGAAVPPFACVILDLVLAEGDGFQVAKALRASPASASLPIIVVSGVYKQLPMDFLAQARPAAFLPKPFEPAQLRDALSRVVGNDSGLEGDLAKRGASAVLVDLFKQKATGTLTLTRGPTVRKLTLQAGQVRFAQSNVKGETAGAAQVASGLIKQAAFDRAVSDAKQRKVPLHEALMASRVLAPEQLQIALRQQTQEVALGGLGWPDGSWRFEPLPESKVTSIPDVRQNVVALVSEAARRFGDPERASTWLGQRAPHRLARTPELERELFALRAAWPAEGVTALAQGSRSLHDVLPRVQPADLPLLMALCESGLITLTAEKIAPAQDDDRGRVFSSKESEARRQLFVERDRTKDSDHYALLGVPTSAAAAEIKTAYFTAAKKFHSDTFSGLELGTARRVAEELFRRVSEAYAVLTDVKKRADYDVYLERKAKGLPTDVSAILRAEQIFLRGEVQYRNGKYEDAEASFLAALALNNSEAEFWAYLGICLFRGKGKTAEGLANVEKALQMDPKLSSALAFAGVLHDALGDQKKAIKLLEQSLAQNEKNAEAQRELSRIRGRQDDKTQDKGSMLSRLFGQNKSKGR